MCLCVGTSSVHSYRIFRARNIVDIGESRIISAFLCVQHSGEYNVNLASVQRREQIVPRNLLDLNLCVKLISNQFSYLEVVSFRVKSVMIRNRKVGVRRLILFPVVRDVIAFYTYSQHAFFRKISLNIEANAQKQEQQQNFLHGLYTSLSGDLKYYTG